MAKVAPMETPSAPSLTPAPSAPSVAPSRWAKDEDIYRISPKKQTLVNTSLPAKMAPALAPATLSALTAQEKRTPLKAKEVALSSESEFPSLGGKKVSQVIQVTQVKATKSFSELSKSWATTQKEDEAKAKEEEKEALRLQQQQAKEAEEFVCGGVQNLSVRTKHLRYVNQRVDDEDDTANLTPPEEEDEDDLPYEEEEEEEEDCDGNWNARKHRDELY
jgi:hypothetical protein